MISDHDEATVTTAVPLAYATTEPSKLSAVVLGAVGLKLIGAFALSGMMTTVSYTIAIYLLDDTATSKLMILRTLLIAALQAIFAAFFLFGAERMAERWFRSFGGIETRLDAGQVMTLLVGGIGLYFAFDGAVGIISAAFQIGWFARDFSSFRDFKFQELFTLTRMPVQLALGLLLFIKPQLVAQRWRTSRPVAT